LIKARLPRQRRTGQVGGSRTWLLGALLFAVIGGTGATAIVLDRPPAPTTAPGDATQTGANSAGGTDNSNSGTDPSVTPDPNISLIPNSVPPQIQGAPPEPAQPEPAPQNSGPEIQIPAPSPETDTDSARGHHGRGILWEASYEAAIAKSKAEGKPVMVDFYTSWCSACKYLDAHVYTDRDVIAESRNFINVRVNAEQRADLAGTYGVNAYPTLEFIRSDGHSVDEVLGAEPAPDFVKEMKGAYAKWAAPTQV